MSGAGAATSGSGGAADEACAEFESATSAAESCRLVRYQCPANFTEYLESLGEYVSSYRAQIGCGLTEISNSGGINGGSYVFDSTGALVGYSDYGEYAGGPCERSSYGYGPRTFGCEDFRTCAIAPDAVTPAEVCACPCPKAPPESGIFRTEDKVCVYENYPGCKPSLADALWEIRYMTSGSVILRGCRQTRTTRGDDLECVYEGDNWVGARRTEPESYQACPGVDVWESGDQYESCSEEAPCWLGTSGAPKGTPYCDLND